jgi:hypothetical protein
VNLATLSQNLAKDSTAPTEATRKMMDEGVTLGHLKPSRDVPLARVSNERRVPLNQLAGVCKELAEELSNLLHSLRLDKKARFRSWEAMRKAIRKAHSANQMKRLEDRLECVIAQINTHLLLNIQ